GSSTSNGLGTVADTGTVWPGLVPHETYGSNSAASMNSSVSKTAPSSVRSDSQYATAVSQSSPLGANGRPRRYSKVVSSGAIMPARAPPSIDMLQIVIRPSIESDSMALPRYSIT